MNKKTKEKEKSNSLKNYLFMLRFVGKHTPFYLFGYLFFVLLGKAGAIIVVALTLFVTVMLVTGTPLMRFIHAVSKPVQKAGEGLQHVYEEASEKMRAKEEEREEEDDKSAGKRRSRIDIEMGDGYVDQQSPEETAMEELRKAAIAEPKEPPQEKNKKRRKKKKYLP